MSPNGARTSTLAMLISDARQQGLLQMWRGATPLMIRGGLLSAGQIGGCKFPLISTKNLCMDELTRLHDKSQTISRNPE